MTNGVTSLPLVSVIMPVRNGGRPLVAAIESILAQSLINFEFIIVEDGSTDETAAILAEYQRIDPRVVVISDGSTGITPSLNRAVAAARGEFIARQDADDTSQILRLAEQVRYLDNHRDCVLCCSWVRFVNEQGEGYLSFRPSTKNRLLIKDFERGLNPIVHGSVMIRRSALSQLSRVYRGGHGEDLDLWLRCMKFGDFGVIPRELYFYRVNSSGLSLRNLAAQRSLRDFIYATHKDRQIGVEIADAEYEQSVSNILSDATRSFPPSQVFSTAQRELRDAIRTDDPGRLKALASRETAQVPLSIRLFASMLAGSSLLRGLIRLAHDWGRGLVLKPVPQRSRRIEGPWIVDSTAGSGTMMAEFNKMRFATPQSNRSPRVSVLMAVHDEKPTFLVQAIESILTQTVESLELVIVDDGSTSEETRGILKRYSEITRRIKLISTENLGLTKALNIGLKHCSAEFIARQDSDDWSAPQRLESQLRFLENHPECGIVGSFATICNGVGERLWVKRIAPNAFSMSKLTKVNPVAHGSLVFRKQFLSEIGPYDERFRLAQDYEILVRAASRSRIGLVMEPLYYLRKHSSARSVVSFLMQRLFAKAARDLSNRDSILLQLNSIKSDYEIDNWAEFEQLKWDIDFERAAMAADLELLNCNPCSALAVAMNLVFRFPFNHRAWARLVRAILFPIKPIRPYLFR